MNPWLQYLEFEILEYDKIRRRWESGKIGEDEAIRKLNRQREFIIEAKKSCIRETDLDLSDYTIPDPLEKLTVDDFSGNDEWYQMELDDYLKNGNICWI